MTHGRISSTQLQDALTKLINRDSNNQEIARVLPMLAVKMTEERSGSWKKENGHWVGYPGFLIQLNSFQFPTESYISEHLQDCLIRSLFHPEIDRPISLSFRRPSLTILTTFRLTKKHTSLKTRLKEEAAIVSVSEMEPTYGDCKYLFAISDNTLYILEECWYD